MKKSIFIFLIMAGLMSACTETEILEQTDSSNDPTTTNSESTSSTEQSVLGEIVPYIVDPDTLPKKISTRAPSDNGYYNRNNNIWAMSGRKFKFRSVLNNYYLYVSNGVVGLNSSLSSDFEIRTYSAVMGIPYTIHFNNSPLAVGYYTNNPDEKIVMVSSSSDLYSASWDLLDGTNSQGSVAVESGAYMGSGSSMWDVWWYVWQVNNSTNLRYGKPAQTSAQEFYIVPEGTWTLTDITYENPTYVGKTEKGTYSMIGTHTNDGTTPKIHNMTITGSQYETSSFTETKTGLRFSMSTANNSMKFRRPWINNGVIVVDTSVPADAGYSTYNSINTAITTTIPLTIPPRTKIDVTYQVKKYEIELGYEATIRDGATGTLCSLVGKWKGIRHSDEHLEPDFKLTNLDTGGIIYMSLPVAISMKIVPTNF